MRMDDNELINIVLNFSQIPSLRSSSFSLHFMYISTRTNNPQAHYHVTEPNTHSSNLIYTASQNSTNAPTT